MDVGGAGLRVRITDRCARVLPRAMGRHTAPQFTEQPAYRPALRGTQARIPLVRPALLAGRGFAPDKLLADSAAVRLVRRAVAPLRPNQLHLLRRLRNIAVAADRSFAKNKH
jgi:hypothetical protein